MMKMERLIMCAFHTKANVSAAHSELQVALLLTQSGHDVSEDRKDGLF